MLRVIVLHGKLIPSFELCASPSKRADSWRFFVACVFGSIRDSWGLRGKGNGASIGVRVGSEPTLIGAQ